MPCDQFLANGPNEPQSPTDVASRPLPKSPVRSSQDNVVPQMIIRSSRVRLGKFVLVDAKRLLQQYPPIAVVPETQISTQSEHSECDAFWWRRNRYTRSFGGIVDTSFESGCKSTGRRFRFLR